MQRAHILACSWPSLPNMAQRAGWASEQDSKLTTVIKVNLSTYVHVFQKILYPLSSAKLFLWIEALIIAHRIISICDCGNYIRSPNPQNMILLFDSLVEGRKHVDSFYLMGQILHIASCNYIMDLYIHGFN